MSAKSENALAYAVGTIALFPVAVLTRAYVFTKLWAWHVAPLFGVRDLSISYAIGLTVLVSMVVPTPTTPERSGDGSDASKNFYRMCGVMFGALISLGFGWLAMVCR